MKPNKSESFQVVKEIKAISNEYVSALNKYIKKMRESYSSELNKVRIDLLHHIAEDYGIPVEELMSKYIKRRHDDDAFESNMILLDSYDDKGDSSEDTNQISTERHNHQTKTNVTSHPTHNMDLLHKITVNDDNYYVDNKEGGNIYDVEMNVIGKLVNGNLEIDKVQADKYMCKRKNIEYSQQINRLIEHYTNVLQQNNIPQ
jgi:hypothetical protein